MTADEQLTHFSKAREQIRERVPSRTEIPSVRAPGIMGNMNPLIKH